MLYLSELLPYELDSKKNASLRNSLKEYQALIHAAHQAIQTVQCKDYQKLDSLVGENACEIRAIWLCCYALKNRDTTRLEKQLITVRESINDLLAPTKINCLMESDISLKTVLQEEVLTIPLNAEELFLIASFILTEVKSLRSPSEQIESIFIKERVDSKKLLQYGEITPSFANNLLSKLRKTLAAASVQFVREQAFALQDSELIAMVSDQFTFIHNALPSIPMFWTYKTLLLTAQQEGIPIIVHAKFVEKTEKEYCLVDEEKLFYAVGHNGIYHQGQPTVADLEKAACIIQGIATVDRASWSKSEWKFRMSQKSVIDVVLAGAADHRQYPDPALDSLFDDIEDGKYSVYKQHALQKGFAVENPSTFFIQHVYSALTSKFLRTRLHIECLEDSHNLTELLPYDPSTKAGDKLKDGLKEYLLLLIAGEQAMEALQRGNLKEFDPLVGENACQIRAVKLALIISQFSFDTATLLKKLTLAQHKTEALLKTSFPNDLALKDLLIREEININMHDNELFLIESFILSKIKTPKAFTKELPLALHESTDTKKLREFYAVSRFFANELVRFLRERVSKKSVTFVQKLADELPSVKTEMVSGQFSINYRGLHCIPGYWTAQILMKHALTSRIPIVILADQKAKDKNYAVVQKMALFFEPTEQGYREACASSFDPDQPALIIVGTTCRESHALPNVESWKTELVEYCPVELMLAATAVHRQYPDSSKEPLINDIQDENYQYHKAKAQEWGCSADNPSRVFLSHVYCDKIKNVC